jgi:hypothetical protein
MLPDRTTRLKQIHGEWERYAGRFDDEASLWASLRRVAFVFQLISALLAVLGVFGKIGLLSVPAANAGTWVAWLRSVMPDWSTIVLATVVGSPAFAEMSVQDHAEDVLRADDVLPQHGDDATIRVNSSTVLAVIWAGQIATRWTNLTIHGALISVAMVVIVNNVNDQLEHATIEQLRTAVVVLLVFVCGLVLAMAKQEIRNRRNR